MMREYSAESRWPEILRDMRRAQDEVNRLFGGLRLVMRAEFPPVNAWVGSDKAVVMAEVPGVAPEHIDVTVHQDTVTLRGKRDPEMAEPEVMVHRKERVQGQFARTLVLPFRIDADNVAARFDRGVLTLDLPRPAADKPRQIKVAGG